MGTTQSQHICNAVAAELLVPESLLHPAWNGQSDEPADAVKELARNFGVSEEVIARRLFDLGLLDKEAYGRLIALYRVRRKPGKEQNGESVGGPDANVLARYRLGAKTLATLTRAADSGLITLQDAPSRTSSGGCAHPCRNETCQRCPLLSF